MNSNYSFKTTSDNNIVLMQRDLLTNFSVNDLHTMARYYGIPTHSNKLSLSRKVAEANLESVWGSKAKLNGGGGK